MSDTLPELFDRVQAFVGACQSGSVTSAQLDEFEGLLCQSEEAQNLYAELIEMSVYLPRALVGVGGGEGDDNQDAMVDSEITASAVTAGDGRLAPHSLSPARLPSFPSLAVSPPATSFGGMLGYVSSGWPVAYLIATVILGMGMLIGALTSVSQPQQVVVRSAPSSPPSPLDASPLRSVVGRIGSTANCQWVNPQAAPTTATVCLGHKYALASGLMEIIYDTGARVILQGPATYEVESPAGGFLSVGKLTARVEKNDECRMINDELQAEKNGIHHSSFITPHLFSVRTPTATVTDLGTEFGVEVAKSGETTSHVFRGSVRVQAIAAVGQTRDDRRILHENESVRVEAGAERKIVVVPTLKPHHFVRAIPKQTTIRMFDLADVVAGGDGFSDGRGRGINPLNGQIVLKPRPEYKSEGDYPAGDRQYHRVEGLPLVDGVFVPDGGLGPVQTDSAGHRFDKFPATCNRSPGEIWVPGEMDLKGPHPAGTMLGGINYALPGHRAVSLSSNKAITFDLEAIRKANPSWRILRFRAMAGNNEDVSAKGWSVLADMMVLVDGQERFKRREICAFNGAFPVNVAIHDKDRFLTLASTDGDRRVICDWIIFGDPRLELAPAASGPKK